MAHLVLVYPDFEGDGYTLIQNYRKDNDELFYSVVDPHFTLIFAVDRITTDAFVSEVRQRSKNQKKIDFTIRCATVNKDAFRDYYHTFLVPDEGHSDLVKLHNKLYSGSLSGNLRLDLDFIPHITVGNSKNKFNCKRMADEWNNTAFAIRGQINKLTIVDYTDNIVTNLQTIELA